MGEKDRLKNRTSRGGVYYIVELSVQIADLLYVFLFLIELLLIQDFFEFARSSSLIFMAAISPP